MQFSESWLRSLCNPTLSNEALCHLLTMSGLEVEENVPGRPLIGGIRKVLATQSYNADTRTTTFNGEPYEREILATNFGRVATMELIAGEFDTYKEMFSGVTESGASTRTLKTRR